LQEKYTELKIEKNFCDIKKIYFSWLKVFFVV